MDLNFYSDLTGGTGPHDGDPEFLDPQSFNGFDTDNKTFHTPSLGDEEFEIPPISLDPDTALSVSDVVSQFGELSDTGPGNVVVEGDDPSFASTFVNNSSQGLEHLSLGVINQPGGALLGSSLGMDLGHPIGSQFGSSSSVTIDVPLGDMGPGLLGSNQLTTIDQSELSAQLGLGLGGGNLLQGPQSPDNPLSVSSSPRGSLQDDDINDFKASVLVDSPVSSAFTTGVFPFDPSLTDISTPGITSAPKKEPKKPVSAYALFFRDTQAAIKGQNANATFGEVSKIVASMWDSLGEEQKQVYKRKNEAAKREYLKALAEYRASHNSKAPIEVMDTAPSPPPPAPSPPVITTPAPASAAPARSVRSQHYNPEENTITNICTSNIIIDLPQVTTRSKTRPAKPTPTTSSTPTHPTVAKIIIKQTQLPSGAVTVTATQASSPRQPPPLQQMQNTPPPPRLQQMVHAQTLPQLHAKPRGGGATAATAPPPLQINVARSSWQSDSSASIIVTSAGDTPTSLSSSALTVTVGQLASVTGDDEVAEEGMEVEVNVAPATPTASPNICVRAGCKNPAVESKDWDKEYCSNECVATHCRDVFMAWCAIRGQNSTTVT